MLLQLTKMPAWAEGNAGVGARACDDGGAGGAGGAGALVGLGGATGGDAGH